MEAKLFAGILGSTIIGSALYAYGTKFEKDIEIKNKYQRIKGSNNSTSQIFMISDKDDKHYRISKTLWFWKFYATELWDNIEVNKIYHVKGYGFRFGFLNMYPNIYDVKIINLQTKD